MRPFLLAASVLALSGANTLLILHVRRQELQRSSSPAFTVGLALFSITLFGLLAAMIP